MLNQMVQLAGSVEQIGGLLRSAPTASGSWNEPSVEGHPNAVPVDPWVRGLLHMRPAGSLLPGVPQWSARAAVSSRPGPTVNLTPGLEPPRPLWWSDHQDDGDLLGRSDPECYTDKSVGHRLRGEYVSSWSGAPWDRHTVGE